MKKIKTPSRVIQDLRSKLNSNFDAIPFDFRSFCQQNLNIRRSDVYTHHLHPYPAKLLPYIPAFFLSDETLISPDETILDPFSGSGTVLLEAMVNPQVKRNAIGVEINPLARLISQVKTTRLNTKLLDEMKRELLEDAGKIDTEPIEFRNMKSWFSKKARIRLQRLLRKIYSIEAGEYRDFFLVCFSRIVRNCSTADPNIPPPVFLKTPKYKHNHERHREMLEFLERSKDPDVLAMFSETVDANIHRMKSFGDVLHNEKREIRADVLWDDARSIKNGAYLHSGSIDKKNASLMPEGSVGGIITSPPYLTAQKYIRSTKLELFWLGLTDDKGVSALDNQTIGSERIPLKTLMNDLNMSSEEDKGTLIDKYAEEVPEIADRIKHINCESNERALDIGRYFFDMSLVLNEMYRVLKPEAHAFVIVGNSKVLGKQFKTHRYLGKIAERVGFRLRLVLRDPIRSRGMLTGRNKTGGLIEDEFVLILQK